MLLLGSALLVACQDRHAQFMAKKLPEGMRDDFLEYYGEGGYKAFAMAIDDDNWVFATAYNARTQASADEWAMYRCIRYRHSKGVTSTCRIFAKGNDYAD
jgi:hypothetical protein